MGSILRQQQPYRDYRTSDAAQRPEQQLPKKLQHQVERLGYQVQLVPITAIPLPN